MRTFRPSSLQCDGPMKVLFTENPTKPGNIGRCCQPITFRGVKCACRVHADGPTFFYKVGGELQNSWAANTFAEQLLVGVQLFCDRVVSHACSITSIVVVAVAIRTRVHNHAEQV